MALKSIEAHNFKSFRDLQVELNDLNVLIGANGAGKSNVLSLLRFIRDAATFGLEDAVSLQGGIGYLTNLSLGDQEPFRLVLTITPETEPRRLLDIQSQYKISLIEVKYFLSLSGGGSAGGLVVREAKATLEFSISGHTDVANSVGVITYDRSGGQSKLDVLLPAGIKAEEIFGYYDAAMLGSYPESSPSSSTVSGTLFGRGWFPLVPSNLAGGQWGNAISQVGVFDLNIKLLKQAFQLNAKASLEEDGSNLAIVLRRILVDAAQRRMLTNLLRDVLPFIADIETEQYADRFLLLKLRESYNKEALPASLLSDGTVYVVALIVALYFSRRSLIAIEEPEKHIHPYLLARVAELLKDAAQRTPIIVTTQNPELVRYVDLQSLLLVTRDKEGYSTIRRPAESQDVQHFLQNEIGIADLFTQNLLGV